jgi:histidinol-phosphate/aromatic aminotransferase/cobyric acid decarboxylase-like protein
MSADPKLKIFDTRFHNPSIFQVRAAAPPGQRDLVDFCVPANSYFPPPQMLADLRHRLHDILKYYPDYSPVHQENIARLSGVGAEFIVPSNGVTELITTLCVHAESPVLTDVPTFGRWTDLPLQYNIPVEFIQRQPERQFELSASEIVDSVRRTGARTLVLCNPSNPTGACADLATIRDLLDSLADLALVVIDESFIDFSSLPSAEHLVLAYDNAIVVKSMGKALGWHGIRLGYGVANATLAAHLRGLLPYWNINGLAAEVLKQMDAHGAEYRASFPKVMADRDHMFKRLSELEDIRVYPSHANFLLVELPPRLSGKQLRDHLLNRHQVFVRECSNKIGSSERYLRLVVRPRPDVDRLVDALRAELHCCDDDRVTSVAHS